MSDTSWMNNPNLKNIDPAKLQAIALDPVRNAYLVLGEKVGSAFADRAKLK